MDKQKLDELLEKFKEGKASKEEALILLKAINEVMEIYKVLIKEVKNSVE